MSNMMCAIRSGCFTDYFLSPAAVIRIMETIADTETDARHEMLNGSGSTGRTSGSGIFPTSGPRASARSPADGPTRPEEMTEYEIQALLEELHPGRVAPA